jgi:hypothetical protein
MEPYIVNFVSAVVGYYASIFANRNSKGILQTIGILTVLAGLTVGLTYLGQWVMKPPPPPPNQYEGHWIERYAEGEKTLYAIATIRYNSETNHLEFSGKSFDLNRRHVGNWHTIQARLDRDQYDYLFEGESLNPDPTKRGRRKGVGGIYFYSPNRGRGIFLAIRDDQVPRDFDLYKILNADAAKESMEDPEGFIQKLHEDQTYFNKVTSANK